MRPQQLQVREVQGELQAVHGESTILCYARQEREANGIARGGGARIFPPK